MILFIQFSAVDNFAALLQLDRYLIRTEAFLIVVIVPDLRHIDVGLFSGMAVGNLNNISGNPVAILDFLQFTDARSIFINSRFSDRIGNLLAFRIHVQLRPLVAPLTVFTRLDNLGVLVNFLRFTLGGARDRTGQCNNDLLRPFAVLVVRVVPLLGNLDLGFLGCVAVCQSSDRTGLMIVRQCIAFR